MMKIQPTISSTPIPSLHAVEESVAEDVSLVASAVQGDPLARREVVEQVFNRVWRALSYMSNRPEDVDDLVQNAVIEILASLGTYRGDAPLVYWAEKIALRCAAKSFAKRKRRRDLFREWVDCAPRQKGQSATDVQESLEMVERFRLCLTKLGSDTRAAIIAHEMNGYSVAEIAAMYDCSLFTIKGRLRRGRRYLRREVLKDPVLADWVQREFGWRQS